MGHDRPRGWTNPKLLFVMGHEMGHYVLGHIWKFVLRCSSCLILMALYGIRRTAGWLIRGIGGGWD